MNDWPTWVWALLIMQAAVVWSVRRMEQALHKIDKSVVDRRIGAQPE